MWVSSMQNYRYLLVPVMALSVLASCDRNEPIGPATSLAEAPSALNYEEFNTRLTIRDVMNTLIDPNADIVWEAVGYEATFVDGETIIVDSSPQSDADWEMLRRNVIAMVEGANSLMIPGRNVAPPGSTTDFPEFEFVPQEVEARLREDRQSWVGFALAFQQANLRVLDAIDARDLDAYVEAGGAVDEACTACHQQYWYRPEFQ